MFHQWKVWNDMRVSKWWQNLYFFGWTMFFYGSLYEWAFETLVHRICSKQINSETNHLLLWIWFPLTQTAHHPWTTFPIMHCTHTFPSTITPITQLSPFTHHSDCLTTPAPHSLTHIKAAHKHSPSAKSCFPLANILSVILPAISVFDPGLPDLGTLNLCLWPRPLPGIVYVSALPLIFLFLPADHCPFVSASAQ